MCNLFVWRLSFVSSLGLGCFFILFYFNYFLGGFKSEAIMTGIGNIADANKLTEAKVPAEGVWVIAYGSKGSPLLEGM